MAMNVLEEDSVAFRSIQRAYNRVKHRAVQINVSEQFGWDGASRLGKKDEEKTILTGIERQLDYALKASKKNRKRKRVAYEHKKKSFSGPGGYKTTESVQADNPFKKPSSPSPRDATIAEELDTLRGTARVGPATAADGFPVGRSLSPTMGEQVLRANAGASEGLPRQVVGRLKRCWPFWRRFATEEVKCYVREGVRLRPTNPEALRAAPPQRNYVCRPEEIQWVTTEIERLMSVGSLEFVAESDSRPPCLWEVSPVHLVPKEGPKKYRLVFNMVRTNSGLPKETCKYETFDSVLGMLGKGWFMVTLDLLDGYHHVEIEEDSRKFLGLRWLGKWYRWRALPFGGSFSPRVFTKIIRTFLKKWRKAGLFVTAYVDDFLIAGPTLEAVLFAREVVMSDLRDSGFLVHPGKGAWEPSQRVKYLGLTLNTRMGMVEIPEDKKAKYHKLLQLVTNREECTARELASVAGKILSISRAFLPARLYTRSLFTLIDAANRAPWQYNETVMLSEEARNDMSWIAENLDRFDGRAMWRPPRLLVLTSDASDRGWGGHLPDGTCAGQLWLPAEKKRDIAYRELLGAFNVMRAFSSTVSGRYVICRIDNGTAWAYLAKGGGRRADMQQLSREIWSWMVEHDVILWNACWVPGKEIPIADLESRRSDTGDWSIKWWIFRRIDRLWGPHEIDRLASTYNRKLEAFDSWRAVPGCKGVDTFSQDWSEANLSWALPPFNLIARVIQHVIYCGARATLVVPQWEAQSWYPLLEAITVRKIVIPEGAAAFEKGASGFVEPWQNPYSIYVAALVDGRKAQRIGLGSCSETQG